ncbi:glycosyltransferase family 4 protein [Pseudomonas sp. 3-2]|uniref:MraY family glycosyltransferase n=1 Tax=Pseudomonas sp. 3-2 TaxID=2867408 RepID=UPI001C876F75|nr:glycosyltransferase family 4 protein [Pseudomonas sp. 3-2]QZD69681.1 glycosyltransferase family 4 protein [Pseudomonas sp. 3-2]
MIFWWLIPAICGLSFALTAGLRRYALARSMLDVPNDRSSHAVPTPRGGGVSIVVTFLSGLVAIWSAGLIDSGFFLGAAGAGALVAVIGFMDDHGHIAARWRLLGHFAAAAWVLWWTGGLAPVEVFGMTLDPGWVSNVFALFYLVWMLNLYNFMDGIDGLASVEAISVCGSACLLYWITGHEGFIWAPLLLAMSVLGFLVWNFPPAKIFMGDAGSGFLGIILGVLALQAASLNPDLLWAWLILPGVFIVDATFTLLRRLLRGEKVYEAHRSHAYQYASRAYGRHLPVTIAVALINVLWLLPVAIAVVVTGLDGATGLIIAYVPLLVLAVKFHAGEYEVKTVRGKDR